MIGTSLAFGTTVAFKILRPTNPMDPKRCRGKMKVLVVDDDQDMTAIIQTMIEKKNHRVMTADDGDGDGENGYSAYLQFKKEGEL